ncbi:Cell division and transport-associated protein TolA [Roseovarius azorensis]|uniref:Cell division and transport-associated protein TolA n=1 Tax=Roseovarius azorensis TaxID=1287727 RepID=A0A1H7FA13_9RHOB|nr:energy transducer TonB [Roseovarius azorensis]SEK22808.1 Cell division and transport-associated protein TolA [Roseovarius azorensis]
MNTGQIISGAGHLALIGWALIGGVFRSDPLPFEVVEATAISTEEYAALIARQSAPEAAAVVDTPEPPAPGEAAPGLSSEADAAPESAPPEASGTPPPDATPDVSEVTPPAPAEVADAAPVLEVPQEDVAIMVPEVSRRPEPRPAPRVAPEPVAQPEPDVKVDEVARPEVTPDESAEVVQEPSEASAPEEAATEIVTEAEKPKETAPSTSLRPKPRPARPAAVAQETPTEAPKPTPTETPKPAPVQPKTDQNSVNAALAAALGGGQQTTERPAGPPLTSGEKDALRVAVQQCWNVGSLSSEALATTVVVTVGMAEDGKPKTGSIRMLSSSGGSDAAARQAFEAARRAIIRCGANGFNLPVEKYDQWRDIEMTFNPERMRIK